MSEPDLTEGRTVVEDEFLMARRMPAPLNAWGATILGPAATTERALSLLARARRVAFALTAGYGASTIPERYRDAAVHQKPFGKVEIANIASALVLPASSP